MKSILIAAALILGNNAAAHEMTPTYFDPKPTFTEGIYSVEMDLFNRRSDVGNFRFEAYTLEWDPLPFASYDRDVFLNEGQGITVDLYFRKSDLPELGYICSRSIAGPAGVSSLICSKIAVDPYNEI
jgi:hypothetical protein